MPPENFFKPSVNVTLPRSMKLNSILSRRMKRENASIGDSELTTSSTSVAGLSAENTNVTSIAKPKRSAIWKGLSASGDTVVVFVSGFLKTFGSAIPRLNQRLAFNFEHHGSELTAVGKAQLA